MKWLFPLLAFVCLASPVLGALGDSEEQLVARYGKQTKTGTSKLPGVTIRGYKYKGFQIVVGVLNSRSAFEMYSKLDQSKMTANEVAALMNVNSAGKTWTVDTDTKFEGTRWVLSDGSVFAEWPKNGPDLTVMTKEGSELEMAGTPKKK